MIDGVRTKPLRWHRDDRGRLMEILRCDDEMFEEFGQVYVTVVCPGYVKGWHYHQKQDDSFAVLAGKVRVGLYDARESSPTKGVADEFILSSEDPCVLRIPRGVVHGFECMGNVEAMVLNVPNMPFNRAQPDEFRIDPFKNDIPFKWHAKKGG
jgi:dTDP-4-dehydrorhamnose 3,5-epimerase